MSKADVYDYNTEDTMFWSVRTIEATEDDNVRQMIRPSDCYFESDAPIQASIETDFSSSQKIDTKSDTFRQEDDLFPLVQNSLRGLLKSGKFEIANFLRFLFDFENNEN